LVEYKSRFHYCTINNNRVFIGFCEERCEESRCPIVIARRNVEIKERLKRVEIKRRKQIEKEQKKLDDLGGTRNLLLRPEDRKS
jgi:hypothetical protein